MTIQRWLPAVVTHLLGLPANFKLSHPCFKGGNNIGAEVLVLDPAGLWMTSS